MVDYGVDSTDYYEMVFCAVVAVAHESIVASVEAVAIDQSPQSFSSAIFANLGQEVSLDGFDLIDIVDSRWVSFINT